MNFDFDRGLVIGVCGKPVGCVKKNGYVEVYVAKSRKLAHRLIWEAANGAIPTGLQINHKNGVKTDNRLVNLEAITPSANIRHARDMGLLRPARGESRKYAKLSDEAVIEIRASAELQRVLAERHGVHQSIISLVKSRKRWAHVVEV